MRNGPFGAVFILNLMRLGAEVILHLQVGLSPGREVENMLKFTEKIGDVELTYEGETVQDIINLKNALNPNKLTIKPNEPLSPDQMRQLSCEIAQGRFATT